MKKLDKYLKGQTEPTELETVTEALIKKTVDQQYRQEWAKELADQHGIRRKVAARSTVKSMYRWVAAVAATLILGILGWQLLQPTSPSYQELAQAYLAEEPFANNEVRKGSEDVGEWRAEAIQAYNQKEYKKSAAVREKVIASGKATEEDYFYQGLSYLYQGEARAAAAITNFQAALAQPNRNLQAEANWFLALAYLQNGQLPEAEELLQMIVADQSWKKDNAAALLKAMVKE